MSSRKLTFNKKLIAAAVGIACAQPVVADIEEIVVTATRRNATVQDIPYNISAVQGDDLAAAGITNLAALAIRIPGISYTDRGTRGGAFNSGIAMRGLSTEDGRLSGPLGTAPAVGTYLNETPLFANLRLTDLERVEVLRGPQGTLYGSGSMGGTLRFIQAKPTTEGFDSEVTAEVGQTKNADGLNNSVDVMFNLPLSDTFALRGNIGQSTNQGWIDRPLSYVLGADGRPVAVDPGNTAPGVINSTRLYTGAYTFEPVLGAGSDIGSLPTFQSVESTNKEKTLNGRVSALWQPNDDFEAQLSYHYQKDEADGNPVQAVGHPDYAKYESPVLTDEPFDGETQVFALDMSQDLGFASVTGSLSHYEIEQEFSGEQTEFYKQFSFYSYTYGFMPRPLVTYEDINNDKADVVELRLTSQGDGKVDWVVGLFYMDQDTELEDLQHFPGYQDWADTCAVANPEQNDFPTGINDGNDGVTGACGAGTTLGSYIAPLLNGAAYVGGLPGEHPNADAAGVIVVKDNVFIRDAVSNFTDKAVFGELTWHATDKLQLTGGFRSFKQEFSSSQVNAAILVDSVDRSTRAFEVDDTLFKFNTAYDLNDDTMAYFTWSEGFRRGGANPIPLTLISFGFPYETAPSSLDYNPDSVTNTEIGLKGSLADRFTYTVAYYDIDWEDVQLNAGTTIFAYPSVLNMGEAESKGIELEFSGAVTDNFYVTLGYSFVDAKLTNPDPEAAEIAIGNPFDSPDAASLAANVATGASAALLAGTRLPGVSEHTASLNLEYVQELSNGWSLTYDLNGTYRSETSGELDPTNATTADAFQLWNAYVILDNGKSWSVRLFVDNMFDEIGVINSANLAQNGDRRGQLISVPQTIGVGLNYRF